MSNRPDSGGNEWTILKVLKWTTSYFKTRSIESPRPSAEILLAHTLKTDRIDLYLRYDQPLNSNELEEFKALIKRRAAKEPVAYITGIKEFWSLELAVTNDVLIPRPETECLVEAVLSLLPSDSADNSEFKPMHILDLGTGSGAIVLALAKERPMHYYFASDNSIKAVEIAKINSIKNNIDNNISFFTGNWFSPVRDKKAFFDIIISNPPYIRTGDIADLAPEICEYEPIAALDGEEDGLGSLRYIINSAYIHLNPRGTLFLETGHDQKDAVKKIIDYSERYENIVFSKDYSGYYRVVRMNKK